MKPSLPEHRAHILEVFLKNITRSLPQYLFWKDTKSIYLGCNENFASLVGLQSSEDIVGKTDRELNWQPPGHSSEEFQQGDQETLSGHPLTNQEEILALPNGKKLITLVSKLPILDKDQKILGIVGYFTDITQLKKKERALKQAKRQAEAANQAKSIFITNISHDLRTPLTGLLGMAEILQQEVQTAQGKAAAADLLKAGQVLLNLLNEVIEFARCESGDWPVQNTSFDLAEVIQNIVNLLKPSMKEKKLKFKLSLDKNVPRYVISDAMRLRRILLNLLSNAIKFTHQGKVNFSVQVVQRQEQQALIKFLVEDTGIGIPENQQKQIFNLFSRLSPSYNGQYGGVGLGLAVVKRFVKDLKGEIVVKSKERQGATFSLLIPFKITSKVSAQHNPRITLSQSLTLDKPMVKKILIVEDNEIVRKAMQHHFVSFGMKVTLACNGAEALKLAQKNYFDLIIMDIGLPDQDGCTVAQTIHELQQHNKQPASIIVALSAHQNEADRQRCLQAGMTKVFCKPLDKQKTQEILALIL
ncbi:MAG: response regulator [Proteobacteria bacterium]|nr:response regulator [Pseudomonadota bacterium]